MEIARGSRPLELSTINLCVYSIDYTPAAAKALRTLPKAVAESLMANIETYASAPYSPHGFATRLKGSAFFRIRQSDWRAIVSVQGERMIVLVLKVGHRRDVYS